MGRRKSKFPVIVLVNKIILVGVSKEKPRCYGQVTLKQGSIFVRQVSFRSLGLFRSDKWSVCTVRINVRSD